MILTVWIFFASPLPAWYAPTTFLHSVFSTVMHCSHFCLRRIKTRGYTFKCIPSSKCTTSVWWCYPTVASSALLVADSTCDSQESSFSAWVDHHPSQERRHEVITKVKSYCATDWCSRREEKLAENQCCVTGKDLHVGGGRTRGSREGGLREELGLKRKRNALERVKGGWGKNTGWIK